MIPNAVASTGPYADLWSHLKSIDHAICRVLDASQLTDFDRERLVALSSLLKHGLSSSKPATANRSALFLRARSKEPEIGASLNLRTKLVSVPEFDAFRKQSKMGFEAKLQSLIDHLDDFGRKLSTSLFNADVPKDELEVLHAIVRSLVMDAEAAM